MQGLEMIPYEWRMGANFVPYEVIEAAALAAAEAKRTAAPNEAPPSTPLPPTQSE